MFLIKLITLLVILCPYLVHNFSKEKNYFLFSSYGIQNLRNDYGGDIVRAVFEIVEGFPSDEISICFDNATENDFIYLLTKFLQKNYISVRLFNLTAIEIQEKYFDFLKYRVENHIVAYSLFFCKHKMYEHILLEIRERNLIRRNIIYIFNWDRTPFSRYFIKNIYEFMKVYVITNPRNDTFRLFYNQATSHKNHYLEKVNWWQQGIGLFHHPTFPNKKSIYKDFNGKVFNIPVIHKPPWYFVKYDNDSLEVLGGRDHRIMKVLSRKLNFRYQYFDPPERIQGTASAENATIGGVLGLIWKRQAEFFIGDVAITYERINFVEFSFITLADSGAFVTHAPSKLNEALALLRPFNWQVWPAIGITFIVVGPVLYAVIALPNIWQPRFRIRSHIRLFFDCTWFTVTILLKQTGREPSSSHKARFFIVLLSISATYVISDMYSANLTSLLARPGREKAINNLYQLEQAMLSRGYNLFVERHSSSYSLLENGTGVYNRLWELMTKKQAKYLVDSVENGVITVRDSTTNAVIAGRETLFFDIQRFGPSYFHLSEKLNTAYSAIAFQMGCPYIEEINNILMAIFEAGIITKMTEMEYEKLGKQKATAAENVDGVDTKIQKDNRRNVKGNGDNDKLQPISLKMLQGAFYLLCIGNGFSGLILVAEILFHKHHNRYFKTKKKKCLVLKKFKNFLLLKIFSFAMSIKRFYRRIMNEAVISTLEYLE